MEDQGVSMAALPSSLSSSISLGFPEEQNQLKTISSLMHIPSTGFISFPTSFLQISSPGLSEHAVYRFCFSL